MDLCVPLFVDVHTLVKRGLGSSLLLAHPTPNSMPRE